MSLNRLNASPEPTFDVSPLHHRRRHLESLLALGVLVLGGCIGGESSSTSATLSESFSGGSSDSTGVSSTTGLDTETTSQSSTTGESTSSSTTMEATTGSTIDSEGTDVSSASSTGSTTEAVICEPDLCLPGEVNVGTPEEPVCEVLIEGAPYLTIDSPEDEGVDFPVAKLSGQVVHPSSVSLVFVINYSDFKPLALPCAGYKGGSGDWECEIEFEMKNACQNVCVFPVKKDFSEGVETCHYVSPQ